MSQVLLDLIAERRAEYLANQKKAAEEQERVKKEVEKKRIKDLIDTITNRILDTAKGTDLNYITLDAVRSYSPDPTPDDLFGDDAVIAHHFGNEGLRVSFFSEPIQTDFEPEYGEYKIGGGDQIRISWE